MSRTDISKCRERDGRCISLREEREVKNDLIDQPVASTRPPPSTDNLSGPRRTKKLATIPSDSTNPVNQHRKKGRSESHVDDQSKSSREHSCPGFSLEGLVLSLYKNFSLCKVFRASPPFGP